MAKIPEIVKISFGPHSSSLNLSNKIFASLWGCIKVQHITDQYFVDNVESVVCEIEEKKPTSYEEFKKIIRYSGLSDFGTKEKEGRSNMWPVMELDDSFWQGVWSYVSGKRNLPYEYKGEAVRFNA